MIIDGHANLPVLICARFASAFLPLFYSVFLHYKFGQTLGKRIMGVKVLDVSETRMLTLRQSLLRDSIYLLAEVVALGYFIFKQLFSEAGHFLYFNEFLFGTDFIFYWTIAELISMLTNPKKRAIHDFLADSVVVRTA